ncbi:superoxide dismutase family protein [Streptomyces albireticuli]|nr:superoxide dismutase family protein [Streptomyces albireticuli]MCD9193507.1 superoxide dismutase family protein [Streptomyces albireticuli]
MAFMTTVLAASLALTPGLSTLSTTDSTSPEGTQHSAVTVTETFRTTAGSGYGAVTYDPKSVPPGSRVEVRERTSDRGTWFELRLAGVQAKRTFGAHVHQKPCGTDSATSGGGHYQNVKDPVQPSVDPAYANARNEAWLDLTTDARGNGRSQTSVRWRVRDGEARSVVVHERATDTRPGKAGTAGARLACVNVPFV